MSEENFYRAFEDRHRGSRDLIKERLNIYRTFIQPLITTGEECSGVDLGCGRGEWLEILEALGVSALGIDLDEGMLRASSERGLNVIHGDAIDYLAQMKGESQLVVSAFHMVEHISFDQLQILVKEAHRVLKPGGLLIMETPNPENIMVAGCSFYLDPTHVRPIPPDLLLFMTEFYHFSRSKIVRLQEDAYLLSSKSLSLNDVLGGASPDYAVVAQKFAPEIIQSKCDRAFEGEYGVNVASLAAKYTSQYDEKIEFLATKALQAETKALQAETKALQAETIATNIYTSYSWRLTGPLRWFGAQYRKLKKDGLLCRLIALVKKLAHKTPSISDAFQNPENHTRKLVIGLSHRMGCYPLVRKLFIAVGGHPNSPSTSDLPTNSELLCSSNDLSPNARLIYQRLKKKSNFVDEGNM